MDISLRLKTIAAYVPHDTVVADIGSDHGHLLSYLLAKNIIKHGYATDNKRGPYERLRARFIAEPRIKVYLADGLEQLPTDVDTIVLAGMGGLLIQKIIEHHQAALSHVARLIISPHQQTKQLREFMMLIGYHIDDETIIEDASQFYDIIVFKKGSIRYSPYELEYGPLNLKRRSPSLRKKMCERIDEIERILEHDIPETNRKRLLIEKEWLENYDQNK